MKLPKIQKACANDELRPVMNYVLITKEEIVASDAHILVIHKTKDYFDSDFIKDLPEEGILIHMDDFVVFTKEWIACVIVDDEIIKVHDKKNKAHALVYEKNGNKNTFPSYKKIIPEKTTDGVCVIGFSQSVMNKLFDALCLYKGSCVVFEMGENSGKPVRVSTEWDGKKAIGVVMPMMINE